MNDNTPLPTITGTQMAAVDRAMVEVCGLELLQVMEVAGRAVAIVARSLMRKRASRGPVVILCGSGGNGGDGLVCARYLTGWGCAVECWLVRPASEYRGLAGHQLQIARRIDVPLREPGSAIAFDDAALIVDGLFGFGLSAAPMGYAAELIQAANAAPTPVLAIDIPSGVDATSGVALEPAIDAVTTLTLGLPKAGLVAGDGASYAGEVVVADIGIPAAAYTSVGIPLSSQFDTAEFVALDGTPRRF